MLLLFFINVKNIDKLISKGPEMTEIINSNQEEMITHRDPRELKMIFEQAEELPTLPFKF